MASFDLYIDGVGNQLVAGAANASSAPLPLLVQGDTLNLRIFLLTRVSGFPVASPPFTQASLAGLTLNLALGDKVGNATNYYSTLFNVAPDATNSFFSGALALNTAAITTLLGSSATATTTLHVEYVSGGLPSTVLEIPVTIQAAVIKAGGGAALPAGQTPLSAELAFASFLQRQIQGAFVLVSPDGAKKVAVYCDNDGTFHSDPIA